MSQMEQQSYWQDSVPQACVPGGDDTACRVTATPDSHSSSPHGDRGTAPSAFVSSGGLRVQWALTARSEAHLQLDV